LEQLTPETIVYQESGYSQPSYQMGRNGFVRDLLENPVILPAGTYYFGWEKISDTPLNVGWDVNNDNSDKVFYNASGFWVNTSFTGSLMLRPVFGTYPDETVSIQTIAGNNNVSIYPNPANYSFNIANINSQIQTVQLFNIEGKQVLQITQPASRTVNVQHLPKGLYLVVIRTNNGIYRKKLMINN